MSDVSDPCVDYVVVGPVYPTDPPVVWCDPMEVLHSVGVPQTPANCAAALSACQEATWVLSSLTSGQYHPAQHFQDIYELYEPCRLGIWHTPLGVVNAVGVMAACGDPSTSTPVAWCLHSPSVLNLCPGCESGSSGYNGYGYGYLPGYVDFPWSRSCGCGRNHIAVDYWTASTLTAAATDAACRLATEKLKYMSGLPCKLPERVTNVTRQGVSWTLFDPQDFLADGLTGVSSVDAFLSVARRARLPVHAHDPLYGRLVTSHLVGEATAPEGEAAPWPLPLAHPDLHSHDTMGLATDAELAAVAEAVTASSGVYSTWVWQAGQTTAVPIGVTRAAVNHDLPGSATQLLIHKESTSFVDYSAPIERLEAGDHVYLQAESNALSFHRYLVTGSAVLAAGTTWMLPVSTETGSPQGTEPTEGEEVLIAFQRTPI